jgi:4-alpha-glucanotransferase
MIFFTDALGLEDDYNRPGTVNDVNWSLRVSPDYREEHEKRVREGGAFHLPRAAARALRSRGAAFVAAHRTLIEDLEAS